MIRLSNFEFMLELRFQRYSLDRDNSFGYGPTVIVYVCVVCVRKRVCVCVRVGVCDHRKT